jgi:hemerythrin-like metal-binding protein
MQENTEFTYGIEWMDFQHRQLIDKFNELDDSCASANHGACETNLPETIDFLERYIDEHFALEEIYMKKSAYPDFKKHEREHMTFANEFRQMRQKLGEKDPERPKELVAKIATWIIHHIDSTDRALASYLLKKSIR